MNLHEISLQYTGTTLPKLIEHQIKSMKKDVLLQAIQGTYQNFPSEICPMIDSYTLDYPSECEWFSPSILTADLGKLFVHTINDIKKTSDQNNWKLNDDQLFDIFNLIVMRISFFAHNESGFRKMLGIKKGWFS